MPYLPPSGSSFYQNAGKPRFWIPITPFLNACGLLGVEYSGANDLDENWQTNYPITNAVTAPERMNRLINLDVNCKVSLHSGEHTIRYNFADKNWIDPSEKYFVGLINTNLGLYKSSSSDRIITNVDNAQFMSNDGSYDEYNHQSYQTGFNSSPDGIGFEHTGSMLREFNFGAAQDYFSINCNTGGANLASFLMGKVYDSADFSSAPDLQMTFTRDYKNTKTTTGRGLQYSNSHYMKNPNYDAFNATTKDDNSSPYGTYGSQFGYSFGEITREFLQGRSDLRRWELSFSLVAEEEMFTLINTITPLVKSAGAYHPQGCPTYDDYNGKGTYRGAGTFEQLLHYTMGDSLPFIFQPDEDNFMPDQFAICRFTSPTFKMERDSFNTYKYSIGIQEEF